LWFAHIKTNIILCFLVSPLHWRLFEDTETVQPVNGKEIAVPYPVRNTTIVGFLSFVVLVFAHSLSAAGPGSGLLEQEEDPAHQHDDVLDVLHEVGVLDDEAHAEAQKKLDQKLSTSIRPTVEFRTTYTPMNETPEDEVVEYPGGPERERGFAVREVDFGFHGRLFYPWLTFKLTAGAEQEQDGELDFGLEEAYLRSFWSPSYLRTEDFGASFGLHLGAMKIPFTRQLLSKEPSMQFINRAVVMDEVEIYRDIGGTLDTRFESADRFATLTIRGGAFNGRGQRSFDADNNDGLLYVARARLDLIAPMSPGEGDLRPDNVLWGLIDNTFSLDEPLVSFGASFLQNNDVDRTVRSWGVDGEIRWMGLSIQGEYLFTDDDFQDNDITPDPNFDSKETSGWYIQGGFFLWPRILEVALRYEEYTRDVPSSVEGEQTFGLTTVGLNVHFASRHRLMYLINYIHRAELEGLPELDNDSVTMMVSLYF
jgi:hypothetical protein